MYIGRRFGESIFCAPYDRFSSANVDSVGEALVHLAACEIVDQESLEGELNYVRSRAAGPVEGVFGPNSLTWRINRESSLLLGAGRALLLQLAHPFVSEAIAEHSTVLDDPAARFHRTFALVFRLIFGTLDQAFAAARDFDRAHARIEGVLKSNAGKFNSGTRYSASDLSARQWVGATLTETSVLTYELVFGELAAGERNIFYDESKAFAALCGVPHESLPPNWTRFATYSEQMVASNMLGVTEQARFIARNMLQQVPPWLPMPRWYSALTTHLLPPRLREEFQLPYGETERNTAEQAIIWIKRVYPLLPHRLRFVGPYQEAVARIDGRPDAGFVVRGLNRLWLGQNALKINRRPGAPEDL
jgi:uncharacterized protein (DUF2236 family)